MNMSTEGFSIMIKKKLMLKSDPDTGGSGRCNVFSLSRNASLLSSVIRPRRSLDCSLLCADGTL